MIRSQERSYDLDRLARVAETARSLAALPTDERRPWDAAAAAKYVADLSAGLENICKRRYHFLNVEVPGGPDSHRRILDDFLGAPELGGTLDQDHIDRLKRYLSFRHRFVHGYGHEVSWEIVEEPLRLLPETVEVLTKLWEEWLKKPGPRD